MALSVSRPLTWLSTIGLTILLPRYLGDVNLGKMNLAFAFADWCGLVASFGIATYLAKEVAQRRNEASTIVLNAVVVRLVLSVVVGAVAGVLAIQLGFDALTRDWSCLLTAHMLLMVFLGALIGALQGVQQLQVVALVDAVEQDPPARPRRPGPAAGSWGPRRGRRLRRRPTSSRWCGCCSPCGGGWASQGR